MELFFLNIYLVVSVILQNHHKFHGTCVISRKCLILRAFVRLLKKPNLYALHILKNNILRILKLSSWQHCYVYKKSTLQYLCHII